VSVLYVVMCRWETLNAFVPQNHFYDRGVLARHYLNLFHGRAVAVRPLHLDECHYDVQEIESCLSKHYDLCSGSFVTMLKTPNPDCTYIYEENKQVKI
jgi:hypothetical protein